MRTHASAGVQAEGLASWGPPEPRGDISLCGSFPEAAQRISEGVRTTNGRFPHGVGDPVAYAFRTKESGGHWA